MKLRRIICVGPRKYAPERQCGKYLGDVDAYTPTIVNPPPCLGCGIQWHVVSRGDGVVEMTKIPRDAQKEYDDNTVYKEMDNGIG